MKRIMLYLIALAISITAHAGVLNVNPVVKVMIFYATDIEKPTHAEVQHYAAVMLEVQAAYQQEMIKHGYGPKTFWIDRKDVSTLNIAIVAGTKPLREYPTWEVLVADIPAEHQLMRGDLDNIQVIFLKGAREFEGFTGLEIKTCWPNNDCLHNSVITTQLKAHIPSVTAHELDHSFWLDHNHLNGFLMGHGNPMRNGKIAIGRLTAQEAARLDAHRYFVPKPIETDASIASQPLPILWGSLKEK